MLIGISSTLTNTDLVQRSFLLIQVVEAPEEKEASDPSGDGERAKQPSKHVLSIEGSQSLVQRSGDGSLELREGDDDRLHSLRGFCEGIFERGDGREDLANTNQDVGTTDDPDIDVRRVGVSVGGHAGRWLIVVARALRVDEVLKGSSVHHCQSDCQETDKDTFDGGEVDSNFAKEWVDDFVKDGDEDNNGNRIEILDQIIGCTTELHACSDGREVSVDL